MITTDHIVLIEGSREEKGATHDIYIRPIYIPKSLSDTAIGDTINVQQRGNPKASTVIHHPFKEELEENTLPLPDSCTSQFYAIGGTGTSDPSTFSILMGPPPDYEGPSESFEHYHVSIASFNSPRKRAVERRPDEREVGQGSIRILGHIYHDHRISALYSNITDGSGEQRAPRDAGRGKKAGAVQRHDSPHAFIYHLQESREVSRREDILVSKTRSISWNDEDQGFDSETGIALSGNREGNTNSTMWNSMACAFVSVKVYFAIMLLRR